MWVRDPTLLQAVARITGVAQIQCGCGVHLQYENKLLPGYTPKKESEYCQRCFRLIHYDDLTVSMRKGIDPDEVMKHISEMDALGYGLAWRVLDAQFFNVAQRRERVFLV